LDELDASLGGVGLSLLLVVGTGSATIVLTGMVEEERMVGTFELLTVTGVFVTGSRVTGIVVGSEDGYRLGEMVMVLVGDIVGTGVTTGAIDGRGTICKL
jgi:hypothetical protein